MLPQESNHGLHMLIVEPEGTDLTYQYMYREGESAPPMAQFRTPFRKSDVMAISDEIDDLLGGAEHTDSVGTQDQLHRLGGRLFDALIPGALQDRLRTTASQRAFALYLSSDLIRIPWELAWDGDECLCEKFWVSRRIIGGTDALDAAERRMTRDRSGRALIIFGDTARLQADTEREQLEATLSNLYGPNVWLYSDQSATHALEELKRDYDICHFVGHGTLDGDGSSGWRFSNGSVLSCADIEAVSSRASFPLLIFANSCFSAKTSDAPAQNYIGSLYQAFLKRGVPHYIGSVGQIPDTLSREFSDRFYRSVARGCSIGEAVFNARRTLRQKSAFPAWACYVHYGDPTHKLVSRERQAHFATPVTLPSDQSPRTGMDSIRTSVCMGRERELEKARKQLTFTDTPRLATFLISGEAGTGKTTLLNHVLDDSWKSTRDLIVANAVANQRLGAIDPYGVAKQLVHSILRSAVPIQIGGKRTTAGSWLLKEMAVSFPHLTTVFRPDLAIGRVRFDEFCESLNVSAALTLATPGEPRHTDIIQQLARLLGSLAAASPLLIAVDNAQWIDDSSAALLAHFAEISMRSGCAIVAAYRSEPRYNAAETPFRYLMDELRRLGSTCVSLDFTTKTAVERSRRDAFVVEYLRHTCPGNTFPRWFTDELIEHTGGNALFLVEILRYLTEKGQIATDGASWTLSANPEDIVLPDSISTLIQQRIDELGDELKEMLACASVEGEHFTAQVLAKVRGIDEDEILSHLLDSLQKRHQIVEELGEHEVSPDTLLSLFNFRNTVIRQQVYQDLSAAQKRRLHKQVGECLEAMYGDKRYEVASQLSAHFRVAREWTKASDYSIAAARASTAMYANREAIQLYKTALDLWELVPDRKAALKCTLLFELAEVFKNAGSYEDAIAAYKRALAIEECPKIVCARSLNGIGDVCRSRGDFADALARYTESERIGVELGDAQMVCEVWTDLSELFEWKCQEERSHGHADEASKYFDKSHEMAQRVITDGFRLAMWDNVRRTYVVLGNLLLCSDKPADAEQSYIRATSLADKYDLDEISINNVGEILRLAGRFEEAKDCYTKYLDWAVRRGALRQEIIARANLGLVALGQHDYENARDSFNKVLDLNAARRHASASLFAFAGKGVAFEMQGALVAADEMYREALAVGGIDPTGLSQLEVRASLGNALSGYSERQLADHLLNGSATEKVASNSANVTTAEGGS
ncbi:MAG: tetratricopeptide repeat protein [Acidobacteriota bacterium]|nr:tetratricopeptide repeat protein [Acidobacteriota bacterium]